MSYEIKVGNIYLNSVGEKCEIIGIQGNRITYEHSNGHLYGINKDTTLRNFKRENK